MRRKLYKGAALIPGKYFNLKDVTLRNHFRGITHRRLDLKAALLKPLCGVSPPPHSSTFSMAEKVNLYWGGMPSQTPMLLLRGPQSTNSTSQIKDLESHWESNQNPFWGVPFPASQWAALSAVQSEIELLYTPLLLLNRKNPWIFSKRRSSEKLTSCRFNDSV